MTTQNTYSMQNTNDLIKQKRIAYSLKLVLMSFLYLLLTASHAHLSAQVQSHGKIRNTLAYDHPFLDASNFTSLHPTDGIGKGLYFPTTDLTNWRFRRVSLDGVSFPTAFDGLLVYNTGTGQTLPGEGIAVRVSPGFYYFYNPTGTDDVSTGRWIRLLASHTDKDTRLDSIYTADDSLYVHFVDKIPVDTTVIGIRTLGGSATDRDFYAVGTNASPTDISQNIWTYGSLRYGYKSEATGLNSFAGGGFSKATGENSAALGFACYAESFASIALGGDSAVAKDGIGAVVIGEKGLSARGRGSVQIGVHNFFTYGRINSITRRIYYEPSDPAPASVGIGFYTSIEGRSNVSIGGHLRINGDNNVVFGQGIDLTGDHNVFFASGDRTTTYRGEFTDYNKNNFFFLRNFPTGNLFYSTSIMIGKGNLPHPSSSIFVVNSDTVYKTSGPNWDATSDIRIKENIENYTKGYAYLSKLRPVSYNYKKKMEWGNNTYVGLIAQEVEKVLPSMVNDMGELSGIKNFKDLNTNDLHYLLVNTEKELHAESEELNNDLAVVEEEQKRLLAELEKIKRTLGLD